jgi:MFS transporter, FHS family, glucose/mannose:H+ symporter
MRSRIAILYLIGLVQGISFTLIPGASAFLVSPQGFHLRATQYGQLFIPMIISAIIASFFGGAIAKKWGIRNVSILSGFLNFLSMIVFALSALYLNHGYILLLICLFFLGSGFGANLATLNSYVFEFFPNRPSAALTALHATLGLGTAIGPLLFQFCLREMHWWIAPLFLAFLYFVLLFFTWAKFPLHLHLPESSTGSLAKRVWLFAAIALSYGICETAFGNWGILFLKTVRGVSNASASLSLSLFWASVTVGRVMAAGLAIRISPYFIYFFISIVLVASLLLLVWSSWLFLPFVIAGFGCSAFLPLTVSFGQKSDLPHAEMISGLIIALYMCGYGVSAYGIGWMQSALQFPLSHLFQYLLIPAIALGFLVFCAQAKKS